MSHYSCPYQVAAGQIMGSSSIARDTNENKKMELQVREWKGNSANFSIMPMTLHLHPIKLEGGHDKFTEINDGTSNRLGYAEEELLRMRLHDFDNEQIRVNIPFYIKKIDAEGTAL